MSYTRGFLYETELILLFGIDIWKRKVRSRANKEANKFATEILRKKYVSLAVLVKISKLSSIHSSVGQRRRSVYSREDMPMCAYSCEQYRYFSYSIRLRYATGSCQFILVPRSSLRWKRGDTWSKRESRVIAWTNAGKLSRELLDITRIQDLKSHLVYGGETAFRIMLKRCAEMNRFFRRGHVYVKKKKHILTIKIYERDI